MHRYEHSRIMDEKMQLICLEEIVHLRIDKEHI